MDALLLDYNGVIVDDEPLHCATFREALAQYGIAIGEPEYYASYLGLNDRASFRMAYASAGRRLASHDLSCLMRHKAEAYAAVAESSLTPVEGVAEFVRAAARRAHIAVVSGALRPEVTAGLARTGIAERVEVVVTADEVEATKPDPAGLRFALRELARRHGPAPWRAVVVEDSMPGLAAARAIGVGCAMLTTSHDAFALGDADLVWPSFAGHVPAELDDLWRAVKVE
jgi:beta-phosphoglucomutase